MSTEFYVQLYALVEQKLLHLQQSGQSHSHDEMIKSIATDLLKESIDDFSILLKAESPLELSIKDKPHLAGETFTNLVEKIIALIPEVFPSAQPTKKSC